MNHGRLHYLMHIHRCAECHRGFYICTERDCDLAPQVCRGCEMDRQDAYLSTLEPKESHADYRQKHEKF